MKILHCADLHIGKVVNGFPLIEDQRHALAGLLDCARAEKVDAIVAAGDLYDKTTPSAEAVAVLDWFLAQIADAGIPLFAVPGNHDSAERVAYAAGPLARQGIYVAPLFDGTLSHVTLADAHGDVTFWLMPFLKPAHVRPCFPDQNIGTDYTAAVKAVLDACPLDEGARNVLVCHQFVTSSGAEPERSDSELYLGGLDNVDASVFDRFDYVALGHIHRPQRIGHDTVRYAGSLLKYSASEIDQTKAATIVELGPKSGPGRCKASLRLVPIKPLHDMRRVKGPLAELTSPEVVGSADARDYLHVTLTDGEPVIDALARLRAVYPNVMSIEYERNRAASAHPGAPLDEGGVLPDPRELFARFFEERTGAALTPDQQRIANQALAEQTDPAAAKAEKRDESEVAR